MTANYAVEKPYSEHLIQLWVEIFKPNRLLHFLLPVFPSDILIADLASLTGICLRHIGEDAFSWHPQIKGASLDTMLGRMRDVKA